LVGARHGIRQAQDREFVSFAKAFFLRGLASLMDFTGSESREFTERILARSDADAMRADWEAVGADLW